MSVPTNDIAFLGLDWLWTLKPWGGVGDIGLGPIRRACKLFGDPQDSFRSMHIAGTNGKGSLTAFLSSIYKRSGLRVGTTISPHLNHVNERISIGGEDISNEELDRILLSIQSTIEPDDIHLSFFEVIILSAFLYFREKVVDIAIFEVGLGGRLDATNVLLHPDATVITSIGLDHQHILGDDKASIAREKAGIVKVGVPLFVGELSIDVLEVVRDVALGVCSDLVVFGSGSQLVDVDGIAELLLPECTIKIQPKLRGDHQVRNAALAALVAHSLGIRVCDIEIGILETFWPARLELLEVSGRRFLLDCAHNVDGFNAVSSYLDGEGIGEGVVVVIGFLKTKKWPQLVDIISKHTNRVIVVSPDSLQAEDVSLVRASFQKKGIVTSVHDSSYRDLVDRLISKEFAGRTILMIGSIYLVAHLREELLGVTQ